MEGIYRGEQILHAFGISGTISVAVFLAGSSRHHDSLALLRAPFKTTLISREYGTDNFKGGTYDIHRHDSERFKGDVRCKNSSPTEKFMFPFPFTLNGI